jgi:hypothetical protein
MATPSGVVEVANTSSLHNHALVSRIHTLIDLINNPEGRGRERLECHEIEDGGEPGASEFGEWSIVIHVQFREGAGLSVLDSHRQSGGTGHGSRSTTRQTR